MMKRNLILFGFTFWVISSLQAQHQKFAITDYIGGKVFVIENDTNILWQHAAPNSNDLWVLPNGNLLFTTGHGVLEMSMNNDTIFNYQSTSEIYACQRLKNGNTFVGECTSGKLLEIAPDGRIVKELKILPDSLKTGGHDFMRNARRLDNGNYLVAHYGLKAVREYDPFGKIVWEVKAPGKPHSVVRLSNGHTLVSDADGTKDPHLYEFDRKGKVVWEVSNADFPEKPFKFLAGIQQLPNGNTIVCNWLGHNQYGTAPTIFEITRDKKIVWSYSDKKFLKTVSSFVDMTTKGKILH